MTSRLEILTPASNLALLSIEELRAAAGLAIGDTSQDTQLEALGLEAAEWIADICGIRTAGGRPPTVLAEDLRETFSPTWSGCELILARRFVSGVTVTENSIAIAEGTDFVVQDDRGVLERIASGYALPWQVAPIVVEYTAGFGGDVPVPATVKAVASDYVRSRQAVSAADVAVRSETTVDLDSVSYFDAGTITRTLEDIARQRLARFIAGGFFA